MFLGHVGWPTLKNTFAFKSSVVLLLLLLAVVVLPHHGMIDKRSRLTGSITTVSSFPIGSIIKDFIPSITR